MKNNDLRRNHHDQFFRKSFEDPRVAREFLKTWLPSELLLLTDLDSLALQPRSHINALRKETVVDVLFKAKVEKEEAYFYLLLEHQSTADKMMAFRILQYTLNTIDYHLKKYGGQKIPFVYPLVVYNGNRPYHGPTDINDLVDAPKPIVSRYFLKPFQLLDLNCIDDEIIKQNTWAGIMLFVLKHIFERDMLPFIEDIVSILQKMDTKNGVDYAGIVLQYILQRAELSNKEKFFDLIHENLLSETEENLMTIAQQLINEGELGGILKGKLEVARNMLSDGFDPAAIKRVTGFSLKEMDAFIGDGRKSHDYCPTID